MIKINYQFNNPKLLSLALTHSSSSQENNERLEFLGDSILNFIITTWLYAKYPNQDEGFLSQARSKLANRETLYNIAQKINVREHLVIGPKQGSQRDQHRLANAVEAIIGAIYQDGSLEACQKTVLPWIEEAFQTIDEKALKDHKSKLQEWCQLNKLQLPLYSIQQQDGPDHAPYFTVCCNINEHQLTTTGKGVNKKDAEQSAAENMLHLIENNHDS